MKSKSVCPISNQVNTPYSRLQSVFMEMPFRFCYSTALKVDPKGEKGFGRQSMS